MNPRGPLPWLLAAAALVAAPAPARAAGDPVEVVEALEQAVADAAAADLSFKDRYGRLARPVATAMDFPALAEARVGTPWAGLEDAQKKSLADLLFKRVTADLATRYEGRGALAFERKPPTEAEGGGVVVASRVTFGGGGGEDVLYRLDPRGDAWKVTAVRRGGVDDLAPEREESARILSEDGFAALESAWKARVAVPGAAPASPSSPAPPAPDAPPTEVVTRLQTTLLEVMKAPDLGYRQRYERLATVVGETHHLAGSAQITMRRHWSSLTDDQKRQFVQRWHDLSIARYASNFDGWAGERFQVVEERPTGQSRLVRTVIVKSDGKRVALDYDLRQVDGRWRILNITADGVSDLATKQAEYASLMASGGFAAVLAAVDAQIRKQESGG
jgi:phospholipid transport system substrate-binding protein